MPAIFPDVETLMPRRPQGSPMTPMPTYFGICRFATTPEKLFVVSSPRIVELGPFAWKRITGPTGELQVI